MREEFFWAQAIQVGGYLITATVVMFFIVLAYRKDSITMPGLFKWAVGLLGCSLLLPVVGMLLTISEGEAGGITMALVSAASPLLFFTSILLALFAMAPEGRMPSAASRYQSRTGAPGSYGTPTSQPSEEPPKPHPLD